MIVELILTDFYTHSQQSMAAASPRVDKNLLFWIWLGMTCLPISNIPLKKEEEEKRRKRTTNEIKEKEVYLYLKNFPQ